MDIFDIITADHEKVKKTLEPFCTASSLRSDGFHCNGRFHWKTAMAAVESLTRQPVAVNFTLPSS